MLLHNNEVTRKYCSQAGVSLVEIVVFIVIVSVALVPLINVYRQAITKNADPLIRIRGLEAAQSLLDEILALKYDENTPTGGIPACGTTQPGALPCSVALGTDGNFNDVDDYHHFTDTPYGPAAGYRRSVIVMKNSDIKLIEVSVTTPADEVIVLAAERANF